MTDMTLTDYHFSEDELLGELKRAITSRMSDNLERAERAFLNYSDTQMDEMHGESGNTRRQILEGYRGDRAKVLKAMELLQAMIVKWREE